ncbi:MAG: NAD(P)-dependent glycerol-3-phosphate dehydrogenase [Candidatus Sumerlaeia bacterium]|nr:NAD(P)-dependent glycerol-3-phosphate dehydrogenase [Candidatus Sumerlaeia bacterium]
MGSPPISVLAAGTWGITLGALLAEKGHDVAAWDPAPGLIREMARARRHPRLPHLAFPASLRVVEELGDATRGCEVAVVVAPSHAVRSLCRRLREERLLPQGAAVVLCTKGIEEDSLALMTQVVEQELGAETVRRTAVLSGPSHAEEVSQGIPTAVVAAAADPDLARRVQGLFMTSRFRVYTQSDVLGVELAAALKNVIAIAAGASLGLGCGDNTVAALITRGLAEIARLGKRLGADPETFAGLAGIGDLVVTAMSEHSRNRRFGRLLAKGLSREEAEREVGMVVEGVRTSRAALALGRREGVEVPITEAVVACVDGQLSPGEALGLLMAREPKPEIYVRADKSGG